jgi:ElaB/YqjD/DUF883 family membrane-anchored ribosome-binding protein
LERAIESLRSDAESQIEKYKESLKSASEEEQSRIKSEMKKVQEFTQADEETLLSRSQEVVPDGGARSDVGALIATKSDKVSKKVGDVGATELKNIMQDMESLYNMMPDEDRDEEKEVDIRITQLVDYSKDIYDFRQENKISGKASGKNLTDLYKQFKKEFPK